MTQDAHSPRSLLADSLEGLLWLLLVTAVLLRFFLPVLNDPAEHLFSDMARHWSNGWMVLEPGLFSAMDPLPYQLLMRLEHTLFGGRPEPYGLINGLLSASLPVIWLLATRAWGFSRHMALMAAVLIGWHPSLIAIFDFMMPETLVLPLSGLATLAAGHAWTGGQMRRYLIAVTLATFVFLASPFAGVLALLLVLAVWFAHSEKRVRAGMGVLLALLLITPPALRSLETLGVFAPAGTAFIARLAHGHDAATISIDWDGRIVEFSGAANATLPLAPVSDWRSLAAERNGSVVYRFRSANKGSDWQGALADLDRPLAMILRHTKENAIHVLFAPSWPDSETRSVAGGWQQRLRWMWAPVAALAALVTLWRILHLNPPHPFVWASVLFLLFLIVQPWLQAEGRMRKVAEPVLIASAVWMLMPRRRQPGRT